MPAAAEIQSGAGYIFGVGAMTLVVLDGTDITGNFSSMRWVDNFTEEALPSQDGATIQTLISTKRNRTLEFDFAPTGVDRAAALAAVDALLELTPDDTITVDVAIVEAAPVTKNINTSYNILPGHSFNRSRDGVAACTLKLITYETSTPDEFLALAKITG